MKQMKKVATLGVACLASLAMPTVAATFEVPRSFEIMYVDLESARQFGNDFKVEVDAGGHQIVVRFNKLLRSGDDTLSFQSEPVVLDLEFDDNTALTLKAPYISTERQAEANEEAPEFTIVDKVTGKEAAYQQNLLATQSGFQNTRDYLEEVSRLTETPETAGPGPVPAPAVTTNDLALDMLKFWFNRSDSATRKALSVWMIDERETSSVYNIQLEMGQFWFKKASTQDRKAFRAWVIE
ncbi:DUF2057 domain-containing protein [Marinomonas algarum]|uniref:DUF2057 domain-containing protein n=1 Tax=Marinomonas algarum TaxID=2883105 RepID=A0A9X1LEQ6_9GAMM|nr:DUF2057 domain-containing protein [Marinomonas algarum]MCB5161605.1 DUF2057 domain-containing protein [Marinomonas algarum]